MEALCHLGAAPVLHWQGTDAAPGILPCRLGAALIYARLLRHSTGCPRPGTGLSSYLRAVSRDFQPKLGLGRGTRIAVLMPGISSDPGQAGDAWQTQCLFGTRINQ